MCGISESWIEIKRFLQEDKVNEICSQKKKKKKKNHYLSQKAVTRSYLPQIESEETDLL